MSSKKNTLKIIFSIMGIICILTITAILLSHTTSTSSEVAKDSQKPFSEIFNTLNNVNARNWNNASYTSTNHKGYQIYSNGVSIRNGSNGKVFNYVVNYERYFNRKCPYTAKDVIKHLGNPTFNDDNLKGYKQKDRYIFFIFSNGSLKEVSFYRNYENPDKNIVPYLINKFNDQDFLNHLCDAYNNKNLELFDKIGYPEDVILPYRSDCNVLCYPSLGIVVYPFSKSISPKSPSDSYIEIYNNFVGNITDTIKLPDDVDKIKNLNNKNVQYKNEDLVYRYEKNRLDDIKNILEASNTDSTSSPMGDKNIVSVCDGPETESSLVVLDKNKNIIASVPSDSNILACKWLNNDWIVYTTALPSSKVCFYNTKTFEHKTVADSLGSDVEYDLHHIDNNCIVFKNADPPLEYTIDHDNIYIKFIR